MRAIRVPHDQLHQTRKHIWAEIAQSDSELSKNAYRQLLATISHPAAIARGRVVRGTRHLQYAMNALILARRCTWPLIKLQGLTPGPRSGNKGNR